MSEERYESSQEDELRKQNTLERFLIEDSLSLSLPRETVEDLLCTSPTRTIPCITDSDVARNIDSQRIDVEEKEENQIVIEDDEFFLDVPTGQGTSSANLADVLINQITTDDDAKWQSPVSSKEAVYSFVSPESDMVFSRSQATTSNESDFLTTLDFHVTVEVRSKRKASDYVFDPSEECLFAKPFVYIPFQVSCSITPPAESIIRVCAFYSQAIHASEPVRRCPHHLASDSKSEIREHFIAAESSFATYIDSRWTGERPHLTVPYPSATDPPFIPLQFRCFSSCTGGINRKPVYINFSLEANGEVLGDKKIALKVCACPTRDAAADGFEPPPKRRRTVVLPTQTEVVTKSAEPSGSSFKEDDETVYEVQIRGRHLYKLVCSIVHNYELSRRYLREKGDETVQVTQLPSRSPHLSHRTSVASWLAGLNLSKYEELFHSKSLHVMDDLEGVINKKFLQSLGIGATDISALLSSYLSWFDVYNARRLSTLSSVGSSIRVQRTRLRSTIREPV